MKKLILLLTLLLPSIAFASSSVVLQESDNDISDQASLQEGAKLFMNYCMGCHSLKYARFKRTGEDLGLTEEQVKADLMFTTDKIGDLMTIAMDKEEAEKWFGVAPPDLSVTARSRGTDWLYTYLLSFYRDSSRPLGINNLLFRDVGMPHVLWELQGWQKPVYKTETDHEGKTHDVIASLELADKGTMDEADYNKKVEDYRIVVRDLVNFLEYIGEPAKLERQRLGIWVLLFLVVFFIFAYFLKQEYWKDIH